jgi:hypothetical protein
MKKILCWLLAFLLAGTLALFGFSFACSCAVEPGLKEGGAVASDGVQQMEMNLIRQKIDELAPVYGFSTETALKLVTPEKIAEMNRQVALWWNGILTSGQAGDTPAFKADELASAFTADLTAAGGNEKISDEEAEALATDAANAVSESILRIVLPLRLPIIGKGLSEANARVDVGNVLRFLLGIRWAALALCALLAGLIALLESRELRKSLPYIGSAMGAAVLVIIAGCVLYAMTGIDPLIAGASPSLAAQYGSLVNSAAIPLFIYTGLLLIGCIACLILCRRQHEAKAD